MEFQPPSIGSAPLSNGSSHASTGEWPAVPPAPTPIKPLTVTLDPPLIRAVVRTPRFLAPGDDSPTIAMAVPTAAELNAAGAAATSVTASTRSAVSAPAVAVGSSIGSSVESSGVAVPAVAAATSAPPVNASVASPRPSTMSVLRQALLREPAPDDLIWQSRFAQITAVVILAVLIPVTLPLWIVLFRLTDPAANNGAGPAVGSLVALCMMLMGAFLAGAATWMIIVEMRNRARMLGALARRGELARLGQLDLATFDPAQLDPVQLGDGHLDPALLGPSPDEANQPVTAPILGSAMPGAGGPMRAARTATLYGQSRPSGGGLRTLGQLPAQVAILAIALALFLGATVLSL